MSVRENEAISRMTAEPLIRVTGLRKAFAGHVVLDDVHLEVRPGEVVALLGANGAGKTTLLRILATLARPSRGSARVAGYDCVREAEQVRAAMSLIAHSTWLYEDLTARENLAFWTTLSGLRSAAGALNATLVAVELDRVADERVRTFSAGMKRRLALARSLLGQPRVLLLDEPFAGLDRRGGKWLDTHLDGFKTGGGAVLLTTHSFGRGLGLADRVAILAGGRIAYDAPVRALDDIRRLYDLYAEDGA